MKIWLMLDLNLPKYDYLLKKDEDRVQIWDSVRNKYVLLTPEEWVRQHFVNFLIIEKKIPRSFISLEKGLQYNKRTKRSDILVFTHELKAALLVECKASHIEISDKAIFQLGTYNSTISCLFLAVTNGISHIYWKMNSNGGYSKIEELPEFKDFG